ncbi:MAG: hypothetical protein IJ672_01770 [Methanobrevibacter sp.]|nr:hypothetical protein [Methanobrevibacter sp.]
MSDFLDYFNKAEQEKAMSEEERFALHKKHKLIAARRHQLEENDDFYKDDEDDISINEGKRIYKKPVRMPAPRPAPRPLPPEPAPMPKPVPRPAPKPIPQVPDDFDLPPAKAPVRDPFDSVPATAPTIPAPKKRRIQTMEESTNPALKEAYSMMDEMQKKIETMFYRYGMAGLEKINECMEEVFEDIVNPRPAEPEIKYIEKPVPSRPKKKIVKKTTSTVTESAPEVKVKKAAPMTAEKVQQAFEDINNSFDVSQIGTSLTKSNNSLNESESIAAKTMKKVQAQAMMLEKSMNKKQEEAAEAVEENYVQPEEFDVVDDDVIDDPIADAKNYDDVDTSFNEHTANTSDINTTPSNEEK